MIIVATLLFVAALVIAWDAFKAWQKLDVKPAAPAPKREREMAAAHD